MSQLKEMYKDNFESAIDCCDFFLFLGSSSKDTLSYVSELIGKESLNVSSSSQSYGKSGSASNSWQTTARALLEPNELMDLPKGTCILIDGKSTTGSCYLSELYHSWEHPRWYLVYDPRKMGDPDNDKKLYRHELYLKKGDVNKYKEKYDNFFSAMGMEVQELYTGNIENLPYDDINMLSDNIWYSGEEFMQYVNMIPETE